MDCSVLLETVAGGKVQVTLRTQKKDQVFAWNVGDSIAKKYFAAIQVELSKARPLGKANHTPVLVKPPAD
jgi:hypothetical protein